MYSKKMNVMQKGIHRDAEVHIPQKKERIIVVNVRNGNSRRLSLSSSSAFPLSAIFFYIHWLG